MRSFSLNQMEDKITQEKLEKYKGLTKDALKIVKENIIKSKEKEAKEIIDMVENYLSDAGYFEKNKNVVDAFAALNYAHGWLDSGVRLGVFNVKDNRLFTIN